MRKIQKKETGITLIALIVTIIILLILAGITISAITGDNGIIREANSAKEQTEISQEREIVDTASTIAMGKDKYGEITKKNLDKELDKNPGSEKYISKSLNNKGILVTFTESQRNYLVDNYGEVIELNLDGSSQDCYTYTYDDATMTATITGLKDEYADIIKDIAIPSSIKENEKSYTVTSIANFAFRNNKTMESVVIPGSITNIGSLAFGIEFDYGNLAEVTFDKDFSGTINQYAFAGSEWILKQLNLETKDYIAHRGDVVINEKTYNLCSFRTACFVAGTKVLTTKGMINIEEINLGDIVYTKNEETNKIEAKKVIKTFENNYDLDTIKIYTQTANVEATQEHKFYVKNQGWTQAIDLKVGDELINNNNVEQKITKIETIKNNGIKKTYNLQLQDNHNYFVGLDSVLVHNTCCFVAGEQVQIDLKGNTKAIEDIKIGDEVLTYNKETGKNELVKVTGTYIHNNATDIVTLKFKDETQIMANMYHPLYTKEGWKSLTRYNGYEVLEKSDIIKTEKGWKEIEEININLNSEPLDLYTLSVEGTDNFYINGTLAHDNEY